MIEHASIWKTGFPISPKTLPTEVDVCIIGSGITGLSAAYALSQTGKKIVIIDRLEKTIAGETSHTTAFLTSYYDVPSEETEKRFNEITAKAVWEIGQHTIDTVEQWIKKETIDCGWQRCQNTVFAAEVEHEPELRTELLYSAKAGVIAEYHDEAHLPFPSYGVMKLHSQAKFHPVQYLRAITKLLANRDIQFIQNTVHSVEDAGEYQHVILNDDVKIRAKDVIVATNYPFIVDPLFTAKLEPYITYVISAQIPKNTIEEGIYEDTNDPYFYFRIDNEGEFDRITLGGADHMSGRQSDEDPYYTLEQYLFKLIPNVEYRITNRWSGEVLNSIDGLPYIGEYKPHQYIASGWAGNGMTWGTYAGKSIAEHIMGEVPVHWTMFEPNRNQNKAGFVMHAAETAFTQAKDLIQAELNIDKDKLGEDDGAIIQEGGKPVAICRNKHGKIRKYSAFCTHMNCVVKWNRTEKTFDCPCHGSRFNTKGEVITGPATKPLKEA